MNFNPNDIGLDNGNIYGLPYNYNESELVILPVPWDVTVSYSDGTHLAPSRIREESLQVDLYDLDYGNFWEKGIYFSQVNEELLELNNQLRPYAKEAIRLLENGEVADHNSTLQHNIEKVNAGCESMVKWVEEQTSKLIGQNKKVLLLGGDHSTPLGYLRTLAHLYPDFGILQIDAHCDLRNAYEGFEYSHASIMYNALKIKSVTSLHQVGIRDFCEDEVILSQEHDKDIQIHFDRVLKNKLYEGEHWKEICENIVAQLPSHIYISFDIDGLLPALCPNTGTPVAGGMDMDQVFYLFNLLKKSNKTIIGIDLNEVGNDVWDANVGARVLYRLCGLWLS